MKIDAEKMKKQRLLHLADLLREKEREKPGIRVTGPDLLAFIKSADGDISRWTETLRRVRDM